MADDGKKPRTLRSRAWYGGANRDAFSHRSWIKNQGHPDHLFDGRPVIGICNTASDLNPCSNHFRELVEPIKRGVYVRQALMCQEFPPPAAADFNVVFEPNDSNRDATARHTSDPACGLRGENVVRTVKVPRSPGWSRSATGDTVTQG